MTPEAKCTRAEPDFLKPTSYQNITNVIQYIGSKAGIKQYGGTKDQIFE